MPEGRAAPKVLAPVSVASQCEGDQGAASRRRRMLRRESTCVGRHVRRRSRHRRPLVHWLLNKPAGYVSGERSQGRPNARSRTGKPRTGRSPRHGQRGLLLLTNDGIRTALDHPRHGVEGVLRRGRRSAVAGGVAPVTKAWSATTGSRNQQVRLVQGPMTAPTLEIVVKKGRKRMVRRCSARFVIRCAGWCARIGPLPTSVSPRAPGGR